MNKNSLRCIALFSLFLLAACASRKNSATLSDQTINKWFDKNEWSGGLQLKPYADIDKREFYIQYHKHPEWWDKTFAYLKNTDLAKAPNGKAPIVGDSVFVTVTEAPDKDFDKTQWESHRNFIDLQYVAGGKEQIMMANPANLTVTVAYNPARDAANYTGEGKSYIAVPGTYYLFFPVNAHRPSIKVPGSDLVKKVTVKIRYSK